MTKNTAAHLTVCLLTMACGLDNPQPQQALQAQAKPEAYQQSPLPAPPKTPATRWEYAVEGDPIRGTHKIASILSETELNFEFPYQGSQNASLSFINGKDFKILFNIDKGQIICFLNCNVTIKIDDGEPFEWGALPPSSGSTTVVLFNKPERLFNKMKAAKNVYMAVTFFQVGAVTIHFDMAGVDWSKIDM
jgi:hypothetical protein